MNWKDIDFTDFIPNDEELMNIALVSGIIEEEDYMNFLLNDSEFENDAEESALITLSVIDSSANSDGEELDNDDIIVLGVAA